MAVAAAFIKRPEPCGSESIRAQPEKWYDERMMPLWEGEATRGPPAHLGHRQLYTTPPGGAWADPCASIGLGL